MTIHGSHLRSHGALRLPSCVCLFPSQSRKILRKGRQIPAVNLRPIIAFPPRQCNRKKKYPVRCCHDCQFSRAWLCAVWRGTQTALSADLAAAWGIEQAKALASSKTSPAARELGPLLVGRCPTPSICSFGRRTPPSRAHRAAACCFAALLRCCCVYT